MKFIKRWYKDYMIRPILYKMVTKVSVGLAAALLWDRFVNVNNMFSMMEFAFLAVGLVMMAAAWFQYLKLDGMKLPEVPKKIQEMAAERKNRHKERDIVDFVDEKIISFDELEEEEQVACNLASDFLGGLIFLIPALVVSILP